MLIIMLIYLHNYGLYALIYCNTATRGLTDLYAQFLRVCMVHLYVTAYAYKYANIY